MGNVATRERIGANGFTVAGERHRAYPDQYTIVGGNGPNDRSAAALLVLYPDDSAKHRRARGIINGARDRLRVAQPPPRGFVDACRNGIVQDVGVADLGEDKNSRTWIVLLVGRQRIMARRILDAEGAKQKPPEPPLYVGCTFAAFIGKDFDAELAALEANAASNCTVPEPFSVKADRAVAFDGKQMAHADIATKIGVAGAETVVLLLALAKCEPCVQEMVDTFKVPLSAAVRLAKLSPDAQAQQMARLKAGTSKKAKDGAAAPRAKAQPRPVVESVVAWLRKEKMLEHADLLTWAMGGPMPQATDLVEMIGRARCAGKGGAKS